MRGLAGPQSLRQLLAAVQSLSSDLDLDNMLQRITQSATDLAEARYGALGVLDPTGTRLARFITVGLNDEQRQAIGDLPDGHGILGLLITDARPIRLANLHDHSEAGGYPANHPKMHSFLGVPVLVRDEVFGNLYLTDKIDGDEFTEVDEELVVGLASAAGVAIENARLHARVRELALTEDRERIARDLHDTVIQRLFATGMSLQSAITLVRSDTGKASSRIEQAIDDLDVTIKEIRTAIFALEQPPAARAGVRSQVLDVLQDATHALGFEPRLIFDGPIDTLVPQAIADSALATLREALSNVAKHAQASVVDVEMIVGDELVMAVRDDGVGCVPPAAELVAGLEGHGLANMAARAEEHGGCFTVERGDEGGTSVQWRVPLPALYHAKPGG